VIAAFNERIQEKLEGSVWSATGKSWYKNEAGRITNNWSGTTIEYWWKTRRPDLGAYHQIGEPRRGGDGAGALGGSAETAST